jgi:plasmid stabilization system protein ParE
MKKAQAEQYKVVVSRQAAGMLVTHARFLAQVSQTAAKNMVDAFEQSAQSLKSMPKRGSLLASAYLHTDKYNKLLFAKRYLLVYQVKDNAVYIDYVLDCRQDYQWLL